MRLAPHLAFVVALLLALLAGAGVAGANPAGHGPARVKDDLTLGVQLEPPNLDPTSGASGPTNEVVYGNIFQGLVRLGPHGGVEPLLAAWWEVAPDGKSYVFHLRRDVRFHDGAPFDAAAVKFSLDRARAPGSTNAEKTALAAIDSVEAVDPATVRVTLRQADSGLLQILALGPLVMVEPRSIAHEAAAPVGTGPFRFVVWRRGESVELERNPAYWGRRPALARVRFKFISDPTAAFAAVKAGDVDAFPDFPAPESLAQFRKDPRLKVVVGATQGKTILAINNRRSPFNNLLVRRAISYALDRKAIIQGAMYGYGQPIGSHYPPQEPGYVDLTGLYPHDPARARALLAQAGYPEGFEATLDLPPPSYARRSGEIIAAQLRAVGIRARIRNLEWSQWLDRVFKAHDFDLTVIAHVEPFDWDAYARDDYYFGYSSPTLKALAAQVKATSDETRRLSLLGQVQRQIAEDAANGFLFEFPRLGVWDARLRGLSPDETVPSDDVSGVWFASGAAAADARGEDSRGGAGAAALGIAVALALVAGVGLLLRRAGGRYLWGRLASLGLTLLVASVVVFALIELLPGDPAALMMGVNASPDALHALHVELGLDQPAPLRYLHWAAGLLHGDFGTSYTYRSPVRDLILERLQVSVPLALLAMVLTLALAFPTGLLAARRPGGAVDRVVMGLSQIGLAVPDFWLGMLLVLVFALGLRLFSAGGFPGWAAGAPAALRALTLPAVALAAPQAAILARVLRAALVEISDEDFMRTARAKGLSRGQALRRHGLRNALIPVLTLIGLQLPFLIAGAIIIENVFFLPGLGRLIAQAVVQRDLMVVQGVVVVLVLGVVVATFLVDVAYAVVDPRLRGRRAR